MSIVGSLCTDTRFIRLPWTVSPFIQLILRSQSRKWYEWMLNMLFDHLFAYEMSLFSCHTLTTHFLLLFGFASHVIAILLLSMISTLLFSSYSNNHIMLVDYFAKVDLIKFHARSVVCHSTCHNSFPLHRQ